MPPRPIELSVREPPSRLLDEPLVLRARGEPGDALTWRARFRDDDGRVWKSEAATPAGLAAAWEPSKPQTAPGPRAALGSLRPLTVDVRVEAPDGRAAGRKLTRLLLAEGVKARRWRDGVAATLYLPAEATGAAPVMLDGAADPSATTVAAALLASRGVLVLAVTRGDVAAAAERLAALPSASGTAVLLDAVAAPPNTGAGADAAAWDALLERVGARPREQGSI
jgi:hypothetical protein